MTCGFADRGRERDVSTFRPWSQNVDDFVGFRSDVRCRHGEHGAQRGRRYRLVGRDERVVVHAETGKGDVDHVGVPAEHMVGAQAKPADLCSIEADDHDVSSVGEGDEAGKAILSRHVEIGVALTAVPCRVSSQGTASPLDRASNVITSAPQSARNILAVAPGMPPPSASTLIPCKGVVNSPVLLLNCPPPDDS